MSELEQWNYDLPEECIARHPAAQRDASRLMILGLQGESLEHRTFRDLLGVLRPEDLLVVNNTRVMAARLFGRRATGGKVEFLILTMSNCRATALCKPARKLKPEDMIDLSGGGQVRILHAGTAPGEFHLEFSEPVEQVMQTQGDMPLPPYLRRAAESDDRNRYQTVYAGPLGAAAAPTAGLHFTPDLIREIRELGTGFESVTLHVGVGTFRPLTEDDLRRGTLHTERYEVSAQTAEAIAARKRAGGRVIAVGTTSLRTLEAATPLGGVVPNVGASSTNLFIKAPYTFRCVDGLLTNFHLPQSSLLMLVGALTGRSRLMTAYHTAVERGYRFYSYGDAMLCI